MSRPDSMIVVETSTCVSPRRKPIIACSSPSESICPCATVTLAVGNERAHPLGRLLDRLDAVVQVEDLAAARQLALDRSLHEVVVVVADVGVDRPAALGRRLDHGDVAQAGERHLQRARDRRRRQREHVDRQAQLAQQLLLLDAEALLLVDDHEAQLLRLHVAREQAVRADQDVDLALARSRGSPRAARPRSGSARAARCGTGSRRAARRTCRSAAARGSWWAPARASACRRRPP